VRMLPALFPSLRSATECTGLIQRASAAVLGVPLSLGVGGARWTVNQVEASPLWKIWGLFPSRRSAAEEPFSGTLREHSLREGLPSRDGRCDSHVRALVGMSSDFPLPCSSFCPISHGRWFEGPRWQ